MKLENPPLEYNQSYEIERNKQIELTDLNNQKRNTDVVLVSPDGTRYKLQVDNSGNLTTTSI